MLKTTVMVFFSRDTANRTVLRVIREVNITLDYVKASRSTIAPNAE